MTELLQPEKDKATTAHEALREATPQSAHETPPKGGLGGFLYKNSWITKEPVTYHGYQFVRAALASIPYGLGMAFFHHMFGLMGNKGAKWGLTPDGFNAFQTGGIGAVDQVKTMHLPGTKAMIGRNMARFAQSPINAAFQIGLAFTMYRFVGGIVKTVRDKIFNEKNTEEDTTREVKNAGKTILETAKTNWPAESTGTPWAALTLGFASANFKWLAPGKPQRQAGESILQATKRSWFHPEGKLLQQAAIFTIAYSIFFEIAERIFKDVQVRRGKWNGHANSLKNTKDDHIVGAPPSGDVAKEQEEKDAKPKHGWLTEDPSLGRLVFRRILPVAVGISAYAAMKRFGYIVAGGPMQPITNEIATGGLKKNLETFGINSWREGFATSMFFTLWAATDAWGTWYDKFFEKQQNKVTETSLTPHQEKNYEELLGRVNQKLAGQGIAA